MLSHKAPRLLRKLVVGIVGFPIVALGLVLIPLPGPGILVTFLGLVVLATEFDWAAHYAQKMRQQLQTIIKRTTSRSDRDGEDRSH